MARRIDIELTSHSDGVWTWRAAGAKQPKGVVEDALVPDGTGVGDVVKADVSSGLDGWEVTGLTSISTPEPAASSGERIEILPRLLRDTGVTVVYAPGNRRRRDDDGRRGARSGPGDRGRRGDRDRLPRERRDATGPGPSETPAPGRRGSGDAGARGDAGRGRPASGRPARNAAGHGEAARSRGEGVAAERGRDRKPAVSTVHRNAYLATLGPEQLPVAEQLLRGGIPAVRRALAEQRRADPAAQVNEAPILAMAEQLLPAVNLASWKDRAVTARAEGAHGRLGELRSVVAAARAVSLDDEGRELSRVLHEMLNQRLTALRENWAGKIGKHLDAGDPRAALQAANRPPEPATRLEAELAVRLAQQTGEALTSTLDPKEWLALLSAVVDSPVRRNVKPVGIPDTAAVREAARNAAGLVPELAKLLGLRIPPPPPRRNVVQRPPLSRAAG